MHEKQYEVSRATGRETFDAQTDLLELQNRQLDREVRAALARKQEAIISQELPSTDSYFGARLQADIEDAIVGYGFDPSRATIAPPNKKNAHAAKADLALNVAAMAKSVGESPVDAAAQLASRIQEKLFVAEAKTIGPYINLEVDYKAAAPHIFNEVKSLGDRYGSFRDGEPKTVIIDYSSPNVAKNMTVAHLRSTIIGESLMKIQEAAGNVSFGINHIGDWGTQFGNIIYQYRKELANRGEEFIEELNQNPAAALMRIYREFNEQKDDNPASVQEGQVLFLRLEQGDPELLELWRQFRDWSLQEFAPSYDRLGVTFDAIQGESFYEDKMASVIEEGLQRGVLERNEEDAIVFPSQPLISPTTGKTNAKIMQDKKGKPRDEVIVKPSGGTVYLTRDLAAMRYRGQELGADEILYVIGKEQQNHCLELFNMADQLGYMSIGTAEHVSFGHLNIDGRKMKSREGKVVLLNDLLDESVAVAQNLIQQRKKEQGDLSELTEDEHEVARKIGISAIIFNDLKQSREKDIEFNPDIAGSLEVGSSVYIQYTNSRINSIKDKAGEPTDLEVIPDEIDTTEKQILSQIMLFPSIVKEAALRKSPHKVATYLTELCQDINLLYQTKPILKAANETDKVFRLNLIDAAQQVIKNAARLLYIELPDRM